MSSFKRFPLLPATILSFPSQRGEHPRTLFFFSRLMSLLFALRVYKKNTCFDSPFFFSIQLYTIYSNLISTGKPWGGMTLKCKPVFLSLDMRTFCPPERIKNVAANSRWCHHTSIGAQVKQMMANYYRGQHAIDVSWQDELFFYNPFTKKDASVGNAIKQRGSHVSEGKGFCPSVDTAEGLLPHAH